METQRVLNELTLAELLAQYPETIAVFNRRKMACVGCDLTTLETLQEAIEIYRLAPEPFLAELARAIEQARTVGSEETK